MRSKERTGQPMASRDHAKAVWVDLRALFSSAGGGPALPDGLVLEVVPGGLTRWVRTATGEWVGVVTWVGRTAGGESVKAADQWIPAEALRPRWS